MNPLDAFSVLDVLTTDDVERVHWSQRTQERARKLYLVVPYAREP
jgi:hypothetical protein